MNNTNNGGPAFPEPPSPQNGFASVPGMTLRDWFAGHALAALISHEGKDGHNCGAKAVPTLATFAYEYADAMLAEREKGGEV